MIVGSAQTRTDGVYANSGVTAYSSAAATSNDAPARLIIAVPSEAKLYVDGRLTNGSGESRQFHTPDLSRGSTYYYELKAELIVDGKSLVEEKRVLVRAGDMLSESFPKLIAAVNGSSKPLALNAK